MAGPTPARVSAGLVRRSTALIGVEVLAQETGLHPEVVLRLVRLGLVETAGGSTAAPLFEHAAASRLARALRLRRDLGLNYAGAALAGELLTRIDDLEERLRRLEPLPRSRGERRSPPSQRPHAEVITWTRIV
ncbi:MAG TPA: chaperone modulator CbpM [Solirubrobacteraceae bacterium]|jgi:hypothetical protein|nr:chaperone modulator CbpM [Solirubrobacteraceae bacterium]